MINERNTRRIDAESRQRNVVSEDIRPEEHQRWCHMIEPVFLDIPLGVGNPFIAEHAASKPSKVKALEHASQIGAHVARVYIGQVVSDSDSHELDKVVFEPRIKTGNLQLCELT